MKNGEVRMPNVECGTRNAASPGATGGLSASALAKRTSARTEVRGSFASRRSAFTLLELMMAIVILGLGLVMVATIFPVAWTRAKSMSEVTARQTIVPTTESTLRGLVPVSDTDLTRAGFAGDLIYVSDCNPGWIAAYSDTRVHMLNTQNLRAGGSSVVRGFVAEDPWRLEMMPDIQTWLVGPYNNAGPINTCPDLALRSVVSFQKDVVDPFERFSYHTSRVTFGQRWYPPLPSRENVDADGKFTGDDNGWDNRFDTRRFGWAVLHRLRKQVGPVLPNVLNPPFVPPLNDYVTNRVSPLYPLYVTRAQNAAKAVGGEREFDIYYVALRRTRPTDRYARQDATKVPSPYALAGSAANAPTPQAMAPSDDVMLPTAWRVQIEVPQYPNIQPAAQATGVPTEVLIPPNNFPGNTPAKVMLVQMFPPGAYFVDEINGQVYKVAQRRVVDAEGSEAVLTLDREITLEDLELKTPPGHIAPPSCPNCTVLNPNAPTPKADNEERLRTVWVFPPATEARDTGNLFPTFDGPPPVVSIEVRSLSILP